MFIIRICFSLKDDKTKTMINSIKILMKQIYFRILNALF